MNKHFITALIGIAMLAVFAASFINGGNKHGDIEEWINGKHAEQVNIRQADADKFCLKCHAKLREETKQQTLTGYCNDCHANRGVVAVNINIKEK